MQIRFIENQSLAVTRAVSTFAESMHDGASKAREYVKFSDAVCLSFRPLVLPSFSPSVL